ncbi:hypothetical protein KZP23_21615 [Echinicola marina]|uniref:hypothetical protein n=1 Tax=Echinicola marina TaxID=2859768 RepID=UPI001CF63EF9|nr:hypothetical protein [Echinicola marina]UCS93215.1 hypothetical protein KZP23_21615 [Echinicola marina]
MDGSIYLVGLGGLVSALLSIIAYFLHYLHRDFRAVQAAMHQLKSEVGFIKVDLVRLLKVMGLEESGSRFVSGK